MAPVYHAIFLLGLSLELVILYRGLATRLWRDLPFFFAYVVFVLLRTLVLYTLSQSHHPAYATIYWRTNALSLFLSFSVPAEIFRHCYKLSPAVRRIAGLILVAVLIGLGTFLLLASNNPGSFYTDFERKISFIQATILVGMLVVAHYYGIRLGRNVWGLALGFGVYVSISMMNFAALDSFENYFPYWQLARPISFDMMLAVWVWALWWKAPNPSPTVESLASTDEYARQWWSSWLRLRRILRKVFEL